MRGYSAEHVFAYPDGSRGRLAQPIYLTLGISEAQVIPVSPRDVLAVLVSVKQGTLDLWIGDMGEQFIATIPQFHFIANQGVQWFPLPAARYAFTVGSTGVIALKACITLVG